MQVEQKGIRIVDYSMKNWRKQNEEQRNDLGELVVICLLAVAIESVNYLRFNK
jgi:hypothetical protein